MKKMRIPSFLMTLVLLLSLLALPARADFTDVPEGGADREAIEWALAAGVALGTGDGRFEPDAPCTRAALVTFLWRMNGAPDMGEDTAWYSDAATWAAQKGLLASADGMEETVGGAEFSQLAAAFGASVDAGKTVVTRGEALCALYDAAVAARRIDFRIADRAEGQKLRLGNTDYFENLTQIDLDYRLGVKGGTLADFQKLAADEVRDFTEEDKAALAQSVARVERRLAAQGLTLPFHDEVIFVKTTMLDEGKVGAYTHKNEIYIGENLLTAASKPKHFERFDQIVLHELFHCLSRNDAPFRAAMYALIGFTVADEVPFAKDVRDHILSNPDVERYDNFASFTVDGKPTNCIIVPYIEDYQEGYGRFFDYLKASLVPVDEPNRFIPVEEVPDFHERVGKNTDYVIAAEECMADNFSFAIVDGTEHSIDGEPWPNPELLTGILDALRS